MATVAEQPAAERRDFLGLVERFGNALPDPVMIFVWVIGLLMLASVFAAAGSWSAVNPVTGEVLAAKSLFSEELVQKLLVEMPKTYAGFTPLGIALTIVLGASVADKSGLFDALLRRSLSGVSATFLTPVVILIGMLTTHAFDAGYLVYIPLAGFAFAAAGRHPIAGLAAGFTGCAVGLAGNLFPGQYDALLFGITETGARLIAPAWVANPIGNWFFIVAIAVAFTTIGWFVTDRIVLPRLGTWSGGAAPDGTEPVEPSPREAKALRMAGLAALIVVALIAAFVHWPGYSPLYDAGAEPGQQLRPFYTGIIASLFFLFAASGWAFGASTGTIRSHRDVVNFMARGLEGMLPYLVLIFFAAHFVAMFGWSNLGPIIAIKGAETLRALNAPPALLLPVLTTMSAWLDFLIASGSAKWTLMAPVATPMLMLLGISPEMTTASYRVGDTVTNLISPLNPYFVLTLAYCRRWIPDFRLGTLLSCMLPYSIAFYIAGALITGLWVALNLPLGPGAGVHYILPQAR